MRKDSTFRVNHSGSGVQGRNANAVTNTLVTSATVKGLCSLLIRLFLYDSYAERNMVPRCSGLGCADLQRTASHGDHGSARSLRRVQRTIRARSVVASQTRIGTFARTSIAHVATRLAWHLPANAGMVRGQEISDNCQRRCSSGG